jgi:hypothetical protein
VKNWFPKAFAFNKCNLAPLRCGNFPHKDWLGKPFGSKVFGKGNAGFVWLLAGSRVDGMHLHKNFLSNRSPFIHRSTSALPQYEYTPRLSIPSHPKLLLYRSYYSFVSPPVHSHTPDARLALQACASLESHHHAMIDGCIASSERVCVCV